MEEQIIKDILEELEKAKSKFPSWPNDPVHAAMVVAEESGELVKDVNELVYEPEKTNRENVRKEALQTAVTAIRFLLSMDVYNFKPAQQHLQ